MSVKCKYTSQILSWGATLEDYEPIKALGDRPVLYGPWPRPYASRSWSFGQDAWYYPDEGIASIEHLNQEELNAKQREIHRVYRLHEAMRDAQHRLDDTWFRRYNDYKRKFYALMDQLSKIECYSCEYNGNRHCRCDHCDGCGSKHCNGCSPDSD